MTVKLRPRSLALSLSLCALLSACSSSPAPVTSIRVLTWNIHHGAGLDGQIDLDRIAAQIRSSGADLVALQEVDRGVLRSDRRDIPAELADRLGMHQVFGKNIDFQGGDYGNAVLSRFPVLESENHHYEMIRKGEQRGLLTTVVRTPAGPVQFWTTHIDYRKDDSERVQHAHAIVERLRSEQPAIPTILCGDFNDRPESRTHAILTDAFRDVFAAVGTGAGDTFPAGNPDRRIDWILVAGPGVTPVSAEVPPTDASDHRPVLGVVRIGG